MLKFGILQYTSVPILRVKRILWVKGRYRWASMHHFYLQFLFSLLTDDWVEWKESLWCLRCCSSEEKNRSLPVFLNVIYCGSRSIPISKLCPPEWEVRYCIHFAEVCDFSHKVLHQFNDDWKTCSDFFPPAFNLFIPQFFKSLKQETLTLLLDVL